MKIKAYQPLLALLFVSGLLQAQTTIPAGGLGDPATLTAPLTVEGDTTVNGTLTVQPEITSTTSTATVDTPGEPTVSGPVVTGTGGDVVVGTTKLSDTTATQTSQTGGGATIMTNGNTNLTAATGTDTEINYSRFTTFEVAQAGNTEPGAIVGQPIAGTAMFLIGTADPVTGVVTPISPSFATEAALDAWIADPANSVETLYAADMTLGTETPLANTGGDLNVDGATTTNGIDNGGEQITKLADGTADDDAATVGQVAAADLAIQQDVDQNEADSDAADLAIQQDVDQNEADSDAADLAEATARILKDMELMDADIAIRGEFAAADAIIQADVDQNEADSDAADVVLDTKINTEINRAIGAENALGVRIDVERTESINRDIALGNRITGESNSRIRADKRLQGNIDENTRGIAMVAAMTNTRVEAGKCHGIDFNISQFQSETGFAFGYANRVNENVQIHCAIASTTDFDEAVGRIGVSYQW